MPATVIYIAIALLFIAVAPLPYGYYTLLRIVATGVFLWAAFVSYERGHEALPWIFGLLAALFNPLIVIHFPKEIWAVIDIASGIFLYATQKAITQRA
ncbi:hypothetical protein BOW50_12530 [Solemya velum gill symbiont]|uniref:DUF6804 family protein n=1 Tax=Solemya velum gill symbiont TaxID=2340 RepID=UPI000996F3F6|nr:DUF6804 family protein [Solemya velum gill symbiont]OOZ74121.1 hypothetical protein BOW50_12530 [Solemya velum gill symbiont]